MSDKILNARIQTRCGTTSQWNAMVGFVPLKGEQIVYLDYKPNPDSPGTFIPGVKIGDGDAFLVDLPFIYDITNLEQQVTDLQNGLTDHINHVSMHVSTNDRTTWNSKVTTSYTESDEELQFF